MTRVGALLVVLIATSAIASRSAHAQASLTGSADSIVDEAERDTSTPKLLVPRAESLAIAWPVRIEAEPLGEPLLPLPQTRNRRGVPFMVAGGILFVAGAIVGGDGGTVLMIGGAGVGAYGAYVYFGGS